MKKAVSLLCGLAMATALSLPGAAHAVEELNFTSPYYDRHPTTVRVFKPWMEEVLKKTDGQLEITYFTPNTICPEAEVLDSVAQGTVDMGGNTFTRNAGRLAVAEMAQIPMLNRYAKTTALAWYEVTQKYPHLFPEFQNDIKLLFVWSSALSQIHTTKKPVRKLEDLKGMKIITWTAGNLETLVALGATPMLQSGADTFLALERGMADGVMCPIAPLKSQKLTELLKYHTIADLALSPFWGGINMELYNDLPENLRKVLDETTGLEFSGIVGQSLEDGANEDIEWIRQQGKAEIILLDDAERARWKEATSGTLEHALEKVAKSGISREDAMSVHNYYLERLAHHNAILEKERGL